MFNTTILNKQEIKYEIEKNKVKIDVIIGEIDKNLGVGQFDARIRYQVKSLKDYSKKVSRKRDKNFVLNELIHCVSELKRILTALIVGKEKDLNESLEERKHQMESDKSYVSNIITKVLDVDEKDINLNLKSIDEDINSLMEKEEIIVPKDKIDKKLLIKKLKNFLKKHKLKILLGTGVTILIIYLISKINFGAIMEWLESLTIEDRKPQPTPKTDLPKGAYSIFSSIKGMIQGVAMIILFGGLFNLGLGIFSQDPSQKSKGIGIIIGSTILFAMSAMVVNFF